MQNTKYFFRTPGHDVGIYYAVTLGHDNGAQSLGKTTEWLYYDTATMDNQKG